MHLHLAQFAAALLPHQLKQVSKLVSEGNGLLHARGGADGGGDGGIAGETTAGLLGAASIASVDGGRDRVSLEGKTCEIRVWQINMQI